MVTLDQLTTILHERFHGVLQAGSHEPDGEACALELHSVALGISWTDDPRLNHTWDVRPLDDISVEASVRTAYMLRVLAAYSGCTEWPPSRQQAVVERLIVLTVQRLIAALPGVPDNMRGVYRGADSRRVSAAAKEATVLAVLAGRTAREGLTARAAAEVARAAGWAAQAARDGAPEQVFITACQLWLEAAREA